jgi:hypothetical protein
VSLPKIGYRRKYIRIWGTLLEPKSLLERSVDAATIRHAMSFLHAAERIVQVVEDDKMLVKSR